MGLGLTITRQVIKQHGGTLEVDSTPGQGTTFTIRIPLASESGLEEGAQSALEQAAQSADVSAEAPDAPGLIQTKTARPLYGAERPGSTTRSFSAVRDGDISRACVVHHVKVASSAARSHSVACRCRHLSHCPRCPYPNRKHHCRWWCRRGSRRTSRPLQASLVTDESSTVLAAHRLPPIAITQVDRATGVRRVVLEPSSEEIEIPDDIDATTGQGRVAIDAGVHEAHVSIKGHDGATLVAGRVARDGRLLEMDAASPRKMAPPLAMPLASFPSITTSTPLTSPVPR